MGIIRKTTDGTPPGQPDVQGPPEGSTAPPEHGEDGGNPAIDSFTHATEPGIAAQPAGSTQRNVLTSPIPNGSSDAARQLTAGETDALIRATADAIAAKHARRANAYETRQLLSNALADLRSRFKPEGIARGLTPSADEMIKSLRIAHKVVFGKHPGKWNDEIDHLIKPFSQFIADNASGLGLVGAKEAGARAPRSNSRRKASAPTMDPAWQARFDALPKTTADGRRFIRYNGGGMADFMEAMHIPAARREREEFEQAFRDAAGITLHAAGNWGMIRSRPSKTEPDRINAVWNALVSQAIAEDRIGTFLRSHRPAHMTDADWSRTIAAGRDQDALRDLALDHHPAEISDEDWKRFTEYHIGLGHPEDVSVEPRKKEALEAIVPAYRFLDEHVAAFGETIDIWDFLAAIYPVVRDILRTADAQGSIRLDIPAQILGDLDPRDWGYNTLAQRLIQLKLITAMNPATLYGHAHGDVGTPYYWNIRDRLVRPLAASSGADERSLNHFWSGVLRVAPVLDRTAEIMGHDGRQMTRPSEAAPTRHAIRLVDDLTAYEGALHLPGRTRARDDIKIRVTSGYYDALNKLAGDGIGRLDHLASSPAAHGVRISMVDGSELSLAGLQERHEALEARAAHLTNAVLDPAPAPEISSREIAAGFRELQAFSEEVIFLTQATGSVASRMGELPFVTATRAARHRIDAGHIATLYLDDVHERAQREAWGPGRIDDAIRLRVIAGHAILRGLIEPAKTRDAAALEAAVLPFWTGDAAALHSAAADVAALEAAADPARLNGREPQVFANGERMQHEILERGPVLPHRRLAPPWRAQWSEHAAQVLLTQDEADRALGAMQAYFEISRGFLIDFNRRVLRTRVEEAFAQGPAGIVDRAFAAITTFFPKVGVADGTAGITSTASELETRLAEEALDAYIAFFPQPKGLDAQVPIDETILRYFVDLCSAAHADANRRRVFAMARAQLELHNSSRGSLPIATEDGMRRLPLTGMLRQEFETALHHWRQEPANARLTLDRTRVWNAAFSLQHLVTDSPMAAPQEITDALKQGSQSSIPGEGDAAFLAAFLEHQRAMLRAWREGTPAFATYVREHYDARYLSDASLAAFAQAYGVARVTSAVPIDPAPLVEAAISDPYLPPREITQRSEGFLRTLLYRWLRDEAAQLSEGGEDLRDALAVAIETPPPPLTEQALIERGLALATGTPTLARAETAERQLSMLKAFLGEPHASPRLQETVHALFVAPKAQAARAAYLREMAATNRELQTIAGTAADLERRSAEAYFTWDRVATTGTRKTETVIETLLRSINSMNAAEADAFVHDSQQRLETLAQLEKELAAASTLPAHAAALIEKLGEHKASDTSVETIEADLARGRELQEALGRVIEGTLDAAEAHRNGLQGVEGELQAIERAEAALQSAASVGTAAAARVDEVVAQGRRTLEHVELSTLVTEEVRNHKGDTASFVAALPHVGDLSRSTREFEERYASLETEMAEQEALVRSALRQLQKAGEGLHDAAIENKVLEAIERLDSLQVEIARTRESLATFRNAVATASAELSRALDAVEKTLPVALPAGLPQPLAEEPISADWEVVTKGASRSITAEAHQLMSPVTEGRVLSLPTRGESRFISQYEARKVEAWIANGRTGALSIMDLFANRIELAPAERGIMLCETRELSGRHRFAVIAENVSRLLTAHGIGVRLVVQLVKCADKTLFHDLLRTLQQPFEDEPHALTSWIQTWALAHREKIAQALGEADAGRIFTSTAAAAPANTGSADHVYPPSYTPAEHARRAQWLEPLLADPRFGILTFRHPDGKVVSTRINIQHFERLTNEANAHRQDTAPAELVSFQGYNETSGTWTTHEIRPAYFVTASVILNNPAPLMYMRAWALALSTPRYRNLAWLNLDTSSSSLSKLAGSLLDEAGLKMLNESPWPLLDQAQEIAVAFHRALKATDGSAARQQFVLQGFAKEADPELAEAFPETDYLLATAKIEALQRMQGNSLITFYPEFANAFIIFEALEHYHLPGHDEVIDHLARAKGNTNAVPTEEAREIVREEFRIFYRHHAAEIRRALQQEVEPGVTLAMRLTGHPEPWKGVNNWEAYPLLDQLRLKVPVVERVLAERVPDFLDRIKVPSFDKLKANAPFGTSDDVIAVELEAVRHMHAVGRDLAARYPLINNAMMIIRLCHKYLSEEIAQKDAKVMLRLSDTENEAERVHIFVEWATDPELLHELYAALQKKAVEFKRGDISLLEYLTGTRTPPWMPELPPPPAEAAPASAPATPAAQSASTPQIAPPEYTAEKHRQQSHAMAQALAHPESDDTASHFKSPYVSDLGLVRLNYRIFTDLAYRDLGYMIQQWIGDPHALVFLKRFIERLLQPIAHTLPGREPPYTLADAQEIAREIYQQSMAPSGAGQNRSLLNALVTDERLAIAFPETSLVTAHRLFVIAKATDSRLQQGPYSGISVFRRYFPEFTGAYSLIDNALGRNESFARAFSPIWGQFLHELKQWKTSDDEAFRRRFRKLYEEYAPAIREALRKEIQPGMTLARALTGLDDPWNGPLTWDRISPADRLKMKSLLFARVQETVATRTLVTIRDDMSRRMSNEQSVWPVVLQIIRFATLHPELEPALAVLGSALNDLPLDLQLVWTEFFNSILPLPMQEGVNVIYNEITVRDSGPEAVSAFVDKITEPSMLRAIYEDMARPAKGTGLSKARYFTGVDEPWLPDVEHAKPAPKPAAAVQQVDADATTTYVPQIAPASYTPKVHAEWARGYDELLSHPELVRATVFREGKEFHTFYTDIHSAQAGMDEARRKGEKIYSFPTYQPNTQQWRPYEIGIDPRIEVRPEGYAIHQPAYLGFQQVMRRIFSDPGLRDLGWVVRWSMTEYNPLLESFLNNLLFPIARTAEGATPPLTLERAQEVAIQVYHAMTATREGIKDTTVLRLFVPQDEELARLHPETGGSIMGAAAKLSADSVIRDAMLSKQKSEMATALDLCLKLLPEFANAFLIMVFSERSLPEQLWNELAEIFFDASLNPARRNFLDLDGLRSRFRAFYDRHAGEIHAALRADVKPGLTVSRRITGLDRPWEGELTWEGVAPLTRLRTVAPIFGRVLEEQTAAIVQRVKDQLMDRVMSSWDFIAFLERFPELHPAFVVFRAALDNLSDERRTTWDAFFKTAWRTWSKEKVIARFVETATEPGMLRDIYAALEQPAPSNPQITRTELLTGDPTPPWMPVVAPFATEGSGKKNGSGNGRGGLPGASSPQSSPPSSPRGAPPASPARGSNAMGLVQPIGQHPVVTGGLMEIPCMQAPADNLVESGAETFVAATDGADSSQILESDIAMTSGMATGSILPSTMLVH